MQYPVARPVKIEWLVPARYAELSADGTMNILGGGVDTLIVSPSVLPAALGVFLAMRVAGQAKEWRNVAHRVTVAVEGPGSRSDVIVDETLRIAEAKAISDPSREIGVLFSASCRWHVILPHIYKLSVALDSEVKRVVPITVVAA